MAEQALYNNQTEPLFPFQAARPQLTWLQNYLDQQITFPPYEMAPFLNTILVFGRARTATLQGRFWWSALQPLVKLLNATLDSLNAEEHRLELAIRGEVFFVTCSHSPRFIWKNRLTHRDVGRNLDFFAPGHFGVEWGLDSAVTFFETGTMQPIMTEKVFNCALNDDMVQRGFQRFNKQRENSIQQNHGGTWTSLSICMRSN